MSSIPDQAIEPDAAMFKLARETIMKRWIEQSIWNSSETKRADGCGSTKNHLSLILTRNLKARHLNLHVPA
ncbi:hypothetical protein VCV18_006781 [Metarhizium anisopliae]